MRSIRFFWYSELINTQVLGDLEEPLLGLTTDYFEELASKISAVFHCGAYVNSVAPYSGIHFCFDFVLICIEVLIVNFISAQEVQRGRNQGNLAVFSFEATQVPLPHFVS
jgi:hypothetical protein